MPQANLTARVESILAGTDCGLSPDALKALQMSNSLRTSRDEYRLPAVQSLEAFRGYMVCDVRVIPA